MNCVFSSHLIDKFASQLIDRGRHNLETGVTSRECGLETADLRLEHSHASHNIKWLDPESYDKVFLVAGFAWKLAEAGGL
jgi:hypothetical protein